MGKPKKKIVKIIIGTVVFLTLPSLLFFVFVYLKYHEDLPYGVEGTRADALATKMTTALNKKAYDSTSVFEWTFKSKRHYKWDKFKQECEVYWGDNKVRLNFKNSSLNQAFIHSFKVDNELAQDLISKAIKHFENDSFWVFAPYKVFENGVKRKLVSTAHGDALLVTYNSVDSYLWHLDNDTGKPLCFKMWTSKLPIDGLESSWTDWTTTESGVQIPTFHKTLFFGMEITDIKGTY